MGNLPPIECEDLCFTEGARFNTAVNVLVQEELRERAAPRPVPTLESALMVPTGSSACNSPQEARARSAEDIARKDKPGRAICLACGRTFRGKYEMVRHVHSVHERRRDFACSKCSKTFTQVGHLNEHFSVVHLESSEHKYADCGKIFGARSKLLRHQESLHS
mmetsp:Transcript_363/g.1222  ORF Transcript_363/g.1222 Transcript_363/m.1222 type:complete len:163 (+) Transcript_363:976-1464(+)